MSDFDDDLDSFERFERDPLDFFEEEPRAPGRTDDHGVRILGGDDADEPLRATSGGGGGGPGGGPPPYDEFDDGDVWPPPRGLEHRFPETESVEDDEFWGERSRPGWAEPAQPREREREPEPEWSETTSQYTEPDSEPEWADAGQLGTEPATGETSGPIALPHWTEPPTGEIPRVVAGADEEYEATVDDDLESWATVSGQTPRYRTEASDWAESDFADPDALKDDSLAVGALSEPDVIVDEDAEFEEEVAARRRGGRRLRAPRAGRRPTVTEEPPQRPKRPRRRPALERGDEMPPPETAGGAGPDLTTRVLTGVAIGVVALIMFKLGRGPAAFMVAVIVGLAAFELYEAFRRAGYHPATILGVLGAMSIVGIAYAADNPLQAFPLVTALVVVFTMLWYMAEVVKARPLVNIAITVFVFIYVGSLGAFGGLLLTSTNGTGLLLGVAICAVGYDVVGYFVGSQLGRSRMAPRLSPNKTWEGLFGGMLASLVLGAIVSAFLTPWDDSLTDGIALGFVVAIVAPLGDLCESMIKRDLGVKDLGTILPGHGGVLDRFDAILFCLPATYYLAIQLGIG